LRASRTADEPELRLTRYALNLYGAEARSDLLKIKNVRNQFAHSDEQMDFSHPKITKLCSKLKAPKYLAEASMKPDASSAKDRFLDAIHHLAAGLNMYALLAVDRPAANRFLQY